MKKPKGKIRVFFVSFHFPSFFSLLLLRFPRDARPSGGSAPLLLRPSHSAGGEISGGAATTAETETESCHCLCKGISSSSDRRRHRRSRPQPPRPLRARPARPVDLERRGKDSGLERHLRAHGKGQEAGPGGGGAGEKERRFFNWNPKKHETSHCFSALSHLTSPQLCSFSFFVPPPPYSLSSPASASTRWRTPRSLGPPKRHRSSGLATRARAEAEGAEVALKKTRQRLRRRSSRCRRCARSTSTRSKVC